MNQIALINFEDATLEEVQSYRLREAVRAVVVDENNMVALLHATKNDYYKLPGGGIEKGENNKEALQRECKEEIGCEIEILGEIGMIVEYRKQQKLQQVSYCYKAKIIGDKGTPELTESETDEGFETVWLPRKEAIKNLSSSNPTIYEGRYMVKRDLTFLEESK